MNLSKIAKRLMMSLLVAGVAAGAGYIYIKKKQTAAIQAERLEAAKPVAAPAITVSKVATEDFIQTAVVSGSLVPREEILVSPEIEGLRVRELLADEGDHVKKARCWRVSFPNRSMRSSLKTKPISRTQRRQLPKPRVRSCKPKPKRKRRRLSSCAPSR